MQMQILLFHRPVLNSDDAEKSPVSHTTLMHSQQYLHNKKRRPNREYQYGANRRPSQG